MTGVERCFKYCEDIEKRRVKSNQYIKLAVKRFRNDLKKSQKDDYPYRFDEAKANRFIAFCENLKQYQEEWKGQPLKLEDWQCFIFANIYGWVNKDTGYRRFRKAFVFVARKNGKAISLDTLINTPDRGLIEFKDIHAGDLVYGVDGMPTEVLWESEIYTDHNCYEIDFGDGGKITCDAGHLWTVSRSGRHSEEKTITAEEMYKEMQKKSAYAHPYRLPETKGKIYTVKNITKVSSVPCKCIAVDNESKLFLVGEHNVPTHNSTMMGTALLWDLLTTNGGQSLAAATKKEQSKIVYNVAKEMVKQNKALSERIQIYNSTTRMVNFLNASYIEALSSTDDKMDGLNPSCVVCDEVAAMKDYGIIKVLSSGMGARKEALLFEITSGSDDLYSAGKQEFDRSIQILKGLEEDDSFFCVLYCLDPEDDWKDSKNDIKANPNLGVSITQEWLDKQRKEAIQVPSLEGEFRVKNCGQFISPITAWILPRKWEVCVQNAKTYTLNLNKPHYAVGAVDLSKRSDLSAFTVCVYQDGRYYLIHKAYFPKEMMGEKIKTDNELWRYWADNGILTATPGNVINYQYIFKDIMDASNKYKLDCVLFDPYNSNALITELQDVIDLIEVPQNLKNMSPFIKRFEEECYKGTIVDNNPLMQWQMSHAEVYRDPNENLKLQKPDSRASGKRIDNVVTSVMALGRIGALLDAGEIDLRSAEDIQAQTEAFLKNLNLYGN